MTLAEQFTRNNGKPVVVDGQHVVMLFRQMVEAGQVVRIRWIKKLDAPVQGISLRAKGGTLRVSDTNASDIVLWGDTSPGEVELVCFGTSIAEIAIWNCWRDGNGVAHAWIGNSGIVVRDNGAGKYLLRCNCRTDISFEDLVFEVGFERP